MASRNEWLTGRILVLEGHLGRRSEGPRSKAERDAAVALDLADPANEALSLAGIAPHDDHRRAAVRAAFRANR